MEFGKKNNGLTLFEGEYSQFSPECTINEFHISREIRAKCDFDEGLFASTGNVILSNTKAVRLFAKKLNDLLAQEIPDPVEADSTRTDSMAPIPGFMPPNRTLTESRLATAIPSKPGDST